MDAPTAERIARQAHDGVMDRHGIPYIEHVRRVARTAPDWARTVAWLHDVVEDTAVTLDDLRARGLTDVQAGALAWVTRDRQDGRTYMDWIRAIAAADGEPGRLARAVKWADLQDNYARPAAQPADLEMKERRYARAIRILRRAMTDLGELPA